MSRRRLRTTDRGNVVAQDELLLAVVRPYREEQERSVYRMTATDLLDLFVQGSRQERVRAFAHAAGTTPRTVQRWLRYESGVRSRDPKGRLTVFNPQSKAFQLGGSLYRLARQYPEVSRCRPIRISVSGWVQISEDCRNRRIQAVMNGPQAWHFLVAPTFAALSTLYFGSPDAGSWYENPQVSVEIL